MLIIAFDIYQPVKLQVCPLSIVNLQWVGWALFPEYLKILWEFLLVKMSIISHMHRILISLHRALLTAGLVWKPGPLAIQPLSIVHDSLPHLVTRSRADSLEVVRLRCRFSFSLLLEVPIVLLAESFTFFDRQWIIKALLISVLLDGLLIRFVVNWPEGAYRPVELSSAVKFQNNCTFLSLMFLVYFLASTSQPWILIV